MNVRGMFVNLYDCMCMRVNIYESVPLSFRTYLVK